MKKELNLANTVLPFNSGKAIDMKDSGKMPDTIINSIRMEFVLIPSGSFRMGGDKKREQAEDHETPRHFVEFSKAFFMGKYEVTQVQWSAIMDNNPSEFKDDVRPVERVSWNDVQAFILKLNTKEETNKYRLPTEAEWEYAARAGSEGSYTFGSDTNILSQYAWYRNNSGGEPHPVGQLNPNAWGLYDMHGNVHEWCQDWFDRKYYSQSPSNCSFGPFNRIGQGAAGGRLGE